MYVSCHINNSSLQVERIILTKLEDIVKILLAFIHCGKRLSCSGTVQKHSTMIVIKPSKNITLSILLAEFILVIIIYLHLLEGTRIFMLIQQENLWERLYRNDVAGKKCVVGAYLAAILLTPHTIGTYEGSNITSLILLV